MRVLRGMSEFQMRTVHATGQGSSGLCRGCGFPLQRLQRWPEATAASRWQRLGCSLALGPSSQAPSRFPSAGHNPCLRLYISAQSLAVVRLDGSVLVELRDHGLDTEGRKLLTVCSPREPALERSVGTSNPPAWVIYRPDTNPTVTVGPFFGPILAAVRTA